MKGHGIVILILLLLAEGAIALTTLAIVLWLMGR
jgi:hypothetical protein